MPSRPTFDGDLADGLRGVGVQQRASLAAQPSDFGQRGDGPRLVVGQHDGKQDRIGAEGLGQEFQPDQAGPRIGGGHDRQQRHFKAAAAKCLERLEHRRVLGSDAEKVPAAGGIPPGRAAGRAA